MITPVDGLVPEIRSKYSPKKRVVVVYPEDEGRTQQHFKEETDVNYIMARYQKSGDLALLNRVKTEFGEFEQFQDLSRYTSRVARAEEAFSKLPQRIQKEFDWQPANLLAALDDESKKSYLQDLGVLNKPEEMPKNEVLETLKGIQENTSTKRRTKKDEPE